MSAPLPLKRHELLSDCGRLLNDAFSGFKFLHCIDKLFFNFLKLGWCRSRRDDSCNGGISLASNNVGHNAMKIPLLDKGSSPPTMKQAEGSRTCHTLLASLSSIRNLESSLVQVETHVGIGTTSVLFYRGSLTFFIFGCYRWIVRGSEKVVFT